MQAGKTTILDLTIKHEALAKQAQAKGKSVFDVQTRTTENSTANGTAAQSVANGTHEEASSISVPTSYGVYIAKTGDISQGGASAGGVLRELGKLELRKKDGYGDLFTEFNNLNIWDNIGRASKSMPFTVGNFE